MASTHPDFHPKVSQQAAERWTTCAKPRAEKAAKFAEGGVCAVEPTKRVDLRLARLGVAVAREQAARERIAEAAGRPSPLALVRQIGRERVLGNPDFQGLGFLESALAVARFVCRVQVRSGLGNPLGYGTGFMVSPRLLLTNHHVLENADLARASLAEFDYQLDRLGRMLPVRTFELDPGAFFRADEKLDYALVAVRESATDGTPLAHFGWVKLVAEQGKALIGDPMNIIQHPRGEPKQLVLRSNKLLDLPAEFPDFAHYETDTEPGSSGSPVFNDQWEVVALHHSGVPRVEGGRIIAKSGQPWTQDMGADQIDWVANEGVRVSSLVAAFKKLQLAPSETLLRDSLLNDDPPHPLEVADRARTSARTSAGGRRVVARPDALDADSNRMGDVGTAGDAAARAAPARGAHAADLALRPGGASFSVPLTVSLTIGAPGGARAGAQLDASARAASRSADLSLRVPARSGDGGDGEDGGGDGDGAFDSGAGTASEAVSIDPDYANRKGYDARFLVPANAAAGHAREVPLPKLSAAQVALAARLSAPQPGRDPLVLDYHHFSVVMNRARKLAFFTAVNIDGRRHFMIQREADRWYYDPRIARSAQAGEAIYRANPLDRGHLVRRLDPAWGSSRPVAKKANDDTFHFTNCSPQHAEFNQRDALWAGLEDYVLQNARTEDLKVTVFTGPVFRAGDPPYRGIRIPTEYWKVVAIGVAGGKLSATAYVVSQSDQIADLEEFAFGAYRTFQVRVSEVERLTGLDFGSLRQHDPLAAAAPGGGPHEAHGEAFGTGRRELFDPGQIVL